MARKWHSQQSKKKCIKIKILFWIQSFYPPNMDFIIRQCCFITLDLTLLLRIQNSYSGSKVIIIDPKFLLWIQSFHSGSKVVTPDPKFLKVIISDPKLLLRIQSYFSGSKVIIPDPNLLLWIQSYYSGSKVFTSDPKIQSNNWSLNTWHPHGGGSRWRSRGGNFSFLFNLVP